MLNFAVIASLLITNTSTAVALHPPIGDDRGPAPADGGRRWNNLGAEPPSCEPGEIEVGEVDNGDGDCSIVSYVGLTEDCRLYTRAELVCADVIFEDLVD